MPLLALLKHPLVGGEGDERLAWLDAVACARPRAARPAPAAGLARARRAFRGQGRAMAAGARPRSTALDGAAVEAAAAGSFARAAGAAQRRRWPATRAWRGPDGRMAAELLAELQALRGGARSLTVGAEDAVPLLRQLLDERRVRPPYGGHPRIFIWGLLEARLQQADLMVLGGLNEGVWPALPAPDPWLAPKIRADLGMPRLDFRIGLAAHDFASALGRARGADHARPARRRSPTVASRFWLRLQAMTGGLPRDMPARAARRALDDPGAPQPADRPRAVARRRSSGRDRISRDRGRPAQGRPVRFLCAGDARPAPLDPVDADHSARWKGIAVHEVLRALAAAGRVRSRQAAAARRALLAGEAIHPMLRALVGAAAARGDRLDRGAGARQPRRGPPAAEGRSQRARR